MFFFARAAVVLLALFVLVDPTTTQSRRALRDPRPPPVAPEFIPHPVALEKMRHGDEIAAVVFVTSKPVDAFAKGKWEEGFKFLPVEYGPKFQDYYISSYLNAADYPNLIARDQRIATIAVPTILAS
jgi:hypothetical protein